MNFILLLLTIAFIIAVIVAFVTAIGIAVIVTALSILFDNRYTQI